MNKIIEMLQQDFMVHVLAGTVIVAAICSYLGVFVVLRRAAFVGAALAQVSSLGIALSMSAGIWLGSTDGHTPHLPAAPFALGLTLLAAVGFALQNRERQLPRESIVAIAYIAAAGLAILVIALTSHAEAETLNLLFGNVLTINLGTVIGLGTLAVLLALVHGLFYRQFLFVSFDPDMATALGLRARWWTVLLYLTLGVAISFTIRAAGSLVVINFLVLPAATALLLGHSLRAVFVLAVLAGVISSLTGITISYVADLPSGPTIIAVQTALLGVAFLVNKWHNTAS